MSQPLKLLTNHIDKKIVSIKDVLLLIDTHFSFLKTDLTRHSSLEDLVQSLDTSDKQKLLEMINRLHENRVRSRL